MPMLVRMTKRMMVAAVVIIGMLIAGCPSPIPNNGAPRHITETVVESPQRTFGIIYPLAHPYYETITEGAHTAALNSNIQLLIKAPDEANLEGQIRMMETMISRKVDGIAINPIDSAALAPVINKAVRAGIPVICFESDCPGSERAAYIGTNQYKAGIQMGTMIDELLGGQGMIIVESGDKRMLSLQQRLEGMLTYMKEQTSIQVLDVLHNDSSDAAALTDIEQMIDDHPHFDVFIAMDALSGSSSILVWKAQGLNRYALTFGLMPEIKEAIRNGQITAALSLQEELWGPLIIEQLLLAAEGEAIPSFTELGTASINFIAD